MRINVLDHGYVEFVEAWGHGSGKLPPDEEGRAMVSCVADYERGIIEAARQSTQGSFRGWDEDQKLLSTLFHHQSNQSTPFEMAGMVIEVQAPIFVFREWHRHRTQSYNEMSARYTPLPDLYYQPDYNNVMERALTVTVNKQAGVVNVPQASFPEDVASWLQRDTELQRAFEEHYQTGLRIGVPKEIARNGMPVSHYTRMRAGANLRNWLAFMTLRCAPNAQWEIRQYAVAVSQLIYHRFPRTHDLWSWSHDPARVVSTWYGQQN